MDWRLKLRIRSEVLTFSPPNLHPQTYLNAQTCREWQHFLHMNVEQHPAEKKQGCKHSPVRGVELIHMMWHDCGLEPQQKKRHHYAAGLLLNLHLNECIHRSVKENPKHRAKCWQTRLNLWHRPKKKEKRKEKRRFCPLHDKTLLKYWLTTGL